MEKKAISQEVILPSRGHLYGESIPGGNLLVTAMTTQEERILAGSGSRVEAKLDIIIEKCAKLQGKIRAEDLLLSDRFYLLIMIRSLSYGSSYGLDVKCPDCNVRTRQEINLQKDLDIRYWPEEGPVTEPFETTLPHSGDTIGFHLLRGKDEKSLARYTKKRLQRGDDDLGDPAYIQRIAYQIRLINGEEVTPIRAQEYTEKLFSMDSLTLRDAYEEKDCGADVEIVRECRACDSEFTIMLPFTAEFFRPRRRKVQADSAERI